MNLSSLRLPAACAALFLLFSPCHAQWTGVRDAVRADRELACGPDLLYRFDAPSPTAPPPGYEAVYVSHYGRHGSRYAYTSKTYTVVEAALSRGAEEGNLTPYGEQVWEAFKVFYAHAEHRVGDLTRKGWEQQRGIASTMLHMFPGAFPAGARIDACVSPSFRSTLSMTSCCLALGQLRPDLEIYEHQSVVDIPATRPNMSNPFAPESVAPPCPVTETPEDFMLRTVDWRTILSRLFKDPDKALGKYTPWQMMDYLYMLVAGMGSVDDAVALDLSGIFPGEDFIRMWEADNYLRFREYYDYLASCCQVYEDIIAKADARLAARERGADLRFGHDHVFLTLLMIAGMDGFGRFPDRADDVALYFQNFRSPMSANLQLAFFRPASRADLRPVLVQILVNGRELRHLGDPSPAVGPESTPGATLPGPFFEWETLKAWLTGRFAMYKK
ncbi:MAG: hypothetical protein IKH49_04355 [Bacteroidales bacterium]|nr:hypothetical protein [Bacteroidales bacterium]